MALAVARVSLAQTPARVGWLSLHSAGMYHDVTSRGFVKGLRESGYEEGKNLLFVKRSAEGDLRKLGALAREIVDAKVDVVFAPAKPMADAAWYASRQIPTVIATVTDPVAVQYANSLASCQEEMALMDKAAAKLGLNIVRLNVTALNPDIEGAMKKAVAAKVQAVVTVPMTTNLDLTDRVAVFANKYHIAFVHDVPQFADAGLAIYGPDFEDIFRRAGNYVARILKGGKPAEMAIEEPRQFKLIVNLKAAKRLGIVVPQAVLLRADEVIQ